PARPVPAIAFVTGTRAPLQPGIAVAITSGHATTVTHERPPAAWDTKPEAHQGDVPTSRTDTQNVFLCRCGCALLDGFYASSGVRSCLRGRYGGPAPGGHRTACDLSPGPRRSLVNSLR